MSTLVSVSVPDIGDFKDIPVIEILVKTGDRVAKETPLVVLESDKATLDVPSPQAGVVGELKVALGDRVSVGSLLLSLDIDPVFEAAQGVPPATSEPMATQAPPPETAAKVVPLRMERAERAAPVVDAPVRSPHASPSIRRMAREFGIDLSVVRGSGRRGRIMKEDMQGFVKTALTAARADGDRISGLDIPPWPTVDFAKFGEVERSPLTKIRKIAGSNLARNSIVIPHVTNFEDSDITELDSFRRALNLESNSPGPGLTLLPFLVKAAASTLAAFPPFNSSLDGDELVLKRYFHIGFAADTPNGLVVPVIRDVNRKGIREIAAEAVTLAAQAREGRLKPTDMQGGCFTISSLGGIGGTGFTPIINAPEVAILGVTRAKMQPLWKDGSFIPRLILPLSLSWDHRVVDGVAAARFLVYLSDLLTDFRRVLL